MTLRKWFYLFLTTLVVGGLGGLLAGVILLLANQSELPSMSGFDWWINLRDFFLSGLLFSIVSQAGFFAYMMLNFIVRGVIRPTTWNLIQMFVIAIAILYLEMVTYSESSSFVHYIVLPLAIFLFSWLVSYFKIKMTNAQAFIPTIFFMVVATTFEAAPTLQKGEVDTILVGIIPLLLCNAWQILILTNLVDNPAGGQQTNGREGGQKADGQQKNEANGQRADDRRTTERENGHKAGGQPADGLPAKKQRTGETQTNSEIQANGRKKNTQVKPGKA
jgi:KinB signaling pathway activation protein